MESKFERNSLVFFVNGQKVIEDDPDPEMTLLDYLHTKLHLVGTKLACGEGSCGACAVMISKFIESNDTVQHYSVAACMFPLCGVHGLAVTTVEGIGSTKNLHPVQERIALFHGTQCGFCTPGMVMSMYTLLRNNSKPSQREIRDAISGNLCRCTGYRSILDGFNTFASDYECPMGSNCCKNLGGQSVPNLGPNVGNLKPFDPAQEIIFPPDLKVNHKSYWSKPLCFQTPRLKWLRPTSLSDLLELKQKYPDARIVMGMSDLIRIQASPKGSLIKMLISPACIPELWTVTQDNNGVAVGGNVPIAQLLQELKSIIASVPASKTRFLQTIMEKLKTFANVKIRNVASMTGNILSASSTADLGPISLAAQVSLTVISKERGRRIVNVDKDFYQPNKSTVVKNDEVVLSVNLPFSEEGEIFADYKQSTRRDHDIAILNAGMMVSLSKNNTIDNIRLAFGGMAATSKLALKTMNGLIGLPWTSDLLGKVQELLALDFPLTPDSPGGCVEYRKALALSLFFKFFLMVKQETSGGLDASEMSAILDLDDPPQRSIQVTGGTDIREAKTSSMSKPLPHFSAIQHSTGEAVFIEDMKPLQGELHLSLVHSSRAHARIASVDPSEALQCPGVVDYVSASDVPGENVLSFMDTVFAVDEVTSEGQVIGCIVADSQAHARAAAKKVKVEYEDLPAILTAKDAIAANSFFHDEEKRLEIGDIQKGFETSDHIIEGEAYIGAQSHFYFETQSSRVIPGENDEIVLYCSTQYPSAQQYDVARALGIPANKVEVKTKRIGGAFGGKETQPGFAAVPAAVAAKKLGHPVRVKLDRDQDMVVTGNRHPFWVKYKIGVSAEGKFQALDMELYCNGGNALDLSGHLLQRTMVQIDTTYRFPNMRLVGKLCKTNVTSNTAFRSFGAIQAAQLTESMVDDVAAQLGFDHTKVREQNFYSPGLKYHYDMDAGGQFMMNVWNMLKDRSNFEERKKAVEVYNSMNKWKKKGIACIPCVYGVSLLWKPLHEAGALVNIYLDGTVLVTHAGIEMGQGIQIKMAQVASETLGIPVSQINISETSTNTVASNAITAASMGTDLNGVAVKKACEKLMERLKPYREKNPDGDMKAWANAAYQDCIPLFASAHYTIPYIDYDINKRKGTPYCYFTYGAACTDVQIDCLTGEHKILRTDIVMDIGQTINPAVDVGQIEGAFTQGLGLMLMEHVKVTPKGNHLSVGPGTYKIPTFSSIPSEFNVYLVPDSDCPTNLYTSRGMNEPGILMAPSAFFAVKDAIRAARKDNGASEKFPLTCPALPDQIRMACEDNFSKEAKFSETETMSATPWFVML